MTNNTFIWSPNHILKPESRRSLRNISIRMSSQPLNPILSELRLFSPNLFSSSSWLRIFSIIQPPNAETFPFFQFHNFKSATESEGLAHRFKPVVSWFGLREGGRGQEKRADPHKGLFNALSSTKSSSTLTFWSWRRATGRAFNEEQNDRPISQPSASVVKAREVIGTITGSVIHWAWSFYSEFLVTDGSIEVCACVMGCI